MGNGAHLQLFFQHVARFLGSKKGGGKWLIKHRRERNWRMTLRTNPLKHLVHDLATTLGVASLYRTKGLDRPV